MTNKMLTGEIVKVVNKVFIGHRHSKKSTFKFH